MEVFTVVKRGCFLIMFYGSMKDKVSINEFSSLLNIKFKCMFITSIYAAT